MRSGSAAAAAVLSEDLLGAARRVVLAGQPRAARDPGLATLVHQPKECLLALARAALEAAGQEAVLANPHFMPIAEWSPDLAVLHFGALELACPVPLARNLMLLDGEDLLGLAEERRAGEVCGLRRQRAELMDRLLVCAPEAGWGGLLPEGRAAPLPVAPLLAEAGRLLPEASRPVRWMECDLETGPYNFLHLRREPTLGTSQVRVLLDSAARGGRPALVAFATPATLCDLGAALRAFAALEEPESRGARLFVFFFGSPEEFAASLAERPYATFFGDNFRCPAIRFLFAPFAAADLLAALGGAAGSIDTCHGGLLDGLARGLGLPLRLVLGPDGRFDAWQGERRRVAGIAWEEVLSPASLARRRHKTDRTGDRALAETLAKLL